MQVVIMAGGKGERIANISQGRPKPMIDICGKPLLEYQIETLKKQNFKDILLITGFKGVQIQDYFKKGEKWGLNIQYYNEEHPLGTAGALSVLKKDLEKHFLLINGDLFFELDFKPLIDFHIGHLPLATVVVQEGTHPEASTKVVYNKHNVVTDFLDREDSRGKQLKITNAGIHLLNKDIIPDLDKEQFVDLDKDIMKPNIDKGRILAYFTSEFVEDIGVPDRYYKICNRVRRMI